MLSSPIEQQEYIKSFGRRVGRTLTKTKLAIKASVMPELSLELKAIFNLTEFFPQATKIAIEIGFGDGERLANYALNNPEYGIIGCEPYITGALSLAQIIQERNINNIRIFADDARMLLKNIPDQSVDEFFILFPDPWPKSKHHKRRIISSDMLLLLYSKLKASGILTIATDHDDYAKWIFNHMRASNLFQVEDDIEFYKNEPENWIKTKYQQRAEIKGKSCFFFQILKDHTSIPSNHSIRSRK